MCIYYGDKEGLTYRGREHIFPAAIGGVATLPNTYVSDQANSYFSKLEGNVIHFSRPSIPRMMVGPGKRGSGQHGTKIIQLLQDGNSFYLGYVFQGIPHSIPQVRVNEDKIVYNIPSDEADEPSAERINAVKIFRENLRTNATKCVEKERAELKGQEIMIGYSDDQIYYYHSVECQMPVNKCAELIKIITSFPLNNYIQTESNLHNVHLLPTITYTNEDWFVYGKIAFNLLAQIMGDDYVKQPEFNGFRNKLIGEIQWDTDDFEDSFGLYGSPDGKFAFPKNSHWCMITETDDHIYAVVSLYDIGCYKFNLGSKPRLDNRDSVIGLICDFRSKKEYTLLEWLNICTSQSKKEIHVRK